MGIGFVIRDSSSKVIRAGIDKVQGDLEVEIVSGCENGTPVYKGV